VVKRRVLKIQQAGAVVVRPGKGEPRILLVTARRNPSNWIFPKGHIEDGETRKDAALREALEEAGIDGDAAVPAGSTLFDFGDNHYRVHYYIVTTDNLGKEREGRRLRWCRYKQALRRLTYDETRELLRRAWPRIQSAVARRPRTARKKR
jgi:8-oxo-dGTP pyrophosphatase MutT (NUDIX family)